MSLNLKKSIKHKTSLYIHVHVNRLFILIYNSFSCTVTIRADNSYFKGFLLRAMPMNSSETVTGSYVTIPSGTRNCSATVCILFRIFFLGGGSNIVYTNFIECEINININTCLKQGLR